MKPAKFTYVRPGSVAEAVRALAESEDCKVLAGGQSLVPLMNFRLAEPPVLIDINRLDDLRGVSDDGDAIVVGAMTRMRDLELSAVVRRRLPLLCEAAHWVGHVQIRNRGTVGGSVAHGDPSAEIVAMCVLLDAEISLTSSAGTRVVAGSDFFKGLLMTAIEPDELLTEIRFPAPAEGAVWGFSEYAQRPGDFALAGAGCVVHRDSRQVKVVAFGPSSRPVRCTSAEDLVRSHELSPDLAADAGNAAISDVAAVTDDFGLEKQHRISVVGSMASAAVKQAANMAEAQS